MPSSLLPLKRSIQLVRKTPWPTDFFASHRLPAACWPCMRVQMLHSAHPAAPTANCIAFFPHDFDSRVFHSFFLRNEIVSFSAVRESVRHLSAKFFPHSTSFLLSPSPSRSLDAVPDARTRLLSSVSNLSSFPLTGHAGVTFANFYRFYDSSALRLAFHGSCLAAQFTPLSTYVPHVDFICASVHGSLFALLLRG